MKETVSEESEAVFVWSGGNKNNSTCSASQRGVSSAVKGIIQEFIVLRMMFVSFL